MTDDLHAGSFWDRHNERMQNPEYAEQFEAELARIHVADAAVDLRISENGWLYQQYDECNCNGPSMQTSAHEIFCGQDPWINLTELPGWAEMIKRMTTSS